MTTPTEALRRGIRHLLRQHPSIRPLDATGIAQPGTKKLDRYLTDGDHGIAHEHNLSTMQHIWVRADAIDPAALPPMVHKPYPAHSPGEKPGRHSNLRQVPGFRHAALIRFTPQDMAEATAIIDAVAGSATP